MKSSPDARTQTVDAVAPTHVKELGFAGAQVRRQARDRALKASMASGGLVRVLTVGLGVASVAISVRALGASAFGVLATLSSITSLMAFADFGIGNGLMTHLAIADGRGDMMRARAMVSTALSGMLSLGSLVAALGVLASVVLPWNEILGARDVQLEELRSAVAAFFVFAGLAIPASIGQRILMGLQHGLAANCWLIGGAAMSLLGIVVVAIAHLPLWCFVSASMGLPVAVGAIQSIWVLSKRHDRLRPSRHLVTRSSLRNLAGVSGLFLALSVATAVAYQTDTLIVASALGAGSAAVFSVGIRMFGLISGTLGAASQQMWTAMAEALARGDLNWVRSRFLRISLGTLAISAPSALLFIALGRPLAQAWVGPELVPPRGLLITLALWTVYSLAMTQISYLLHAAQIVGPQVVMALSMTATNLPLSWYLTRHLGLSGPLIGSLIAHIVFAGMPAVILAIRVLRVRPSLEKTGTS